MNLRRDIATTGKTSTTPVWDLNALKLTPGLRAGGRGVIVNTWASCITCQEQVGGGVEFLYSSLATPAIQSIDRTC